MYSSRLFPSGLVLLSGGGDMRLRVMSVEDGRCPVTLVGHTGAVTDTAIVGLGKLVISVARDGETRLWQLATAECKAVVGRLGQAASCCCLLPPGSPFQPLLKEQEDSMAAMAEGTEGLLLAVGGEEGALALVAVEGREQVWLHVLVSGV